MDKAVLTRISDEVQGHLRLPTDHRPTVELYAKRVLTQALSLCHREDVPPGLETLAAEMVEARLRMDGAVPGISGDPEVASITRGDTAISYRDKGAGEKAADTFFKDYAAQLRPFKKMNLPKGG